MYAEFQRITNQNLPNTFYAELDRHTPRLMTLFRQRASKTGKIADYLANIFKVHDEEVSIHFSRLKSLCSLIFKSVTFIDSNELLNSIISPLHSLCYYGVADRLSRL